MGIIHLVLPMIFLAIADLEGRITWQTHHNDAL